MTSRGNAMTEITTGTLPSKFRSAVASHFTAEVPRRADLYLLTPEITTALRRAPNPQHRILAEFEKHERIWKDETQFFSSPAQIYLHPSYARIIGLGWPAVQLILQSLMQEPADWFYALRALTGVDPVPHAAAGDMAEMTRAWLKWGEEHGLG
jgi:hypothetical protein